MFSLYTFSYSCDVWKCIKNCKICYNEQDSSNLIKAGSHLFILHFSVINFSVSTSTATKFFYLYTASSLPSNNGGPKATLDAPYNSKRFCGFTQIHMFFHHHSGFHEAIHVITSDTFLQIQMHFTNSCGGCFCIWA